MTISNFCHGTNHYNLVRFYDEEAARVREDDWNEAALVRADERSERATDWTAAISLISGIASGYFTMATEVQGGKRKRLAENREEGPV